MAIILNPELEQRIALKVESGQYHSADEVIEQGIELLEARDSSSIQPEDDDRPIWEIIAEIGRSIPDEDLAKIPTDSSINLDHYLYGAPKVSE